MDDDDDDVFDQFVRRPQQRLSELDRDPAPPPPPPAATSGSSCAAPTHAVESRPPWPFAALSTPAAAPSAPPGVGADPASADEDAAAGDDDAALPLEEAAGAVAKRGSKKQFLRLQRLSDSELAPEGGDHEPAADRPAGTLRDYLWLAAFVGSGIAIGQCFEVLQIHAGPARYDTFFLSLLGYWANFLVGGAWLVAKFGLRGAAGGFRPDRWTRPMLLALAGSAVLDGGAQGLNYVAQVEGGYMLFTIFQSSVTLFVCVIATFVLGARLSGRQWAGVGSIVAGLLLTSIPQPLVARHSFALGLACSMAGSLCLASSYPLAELVFRLAPRAPPSPELACVAGSMINVGFFTLWTLGYTAPRWDEGVVQPMRDSLEPSVGWAVFGYSMFALMVGLHSLAFWKSVCRLGTVPTAISRGAQQAGVFLVAHLLFCSSDPTECIWTNGRGEQTAWSQWQKSVALCCCVAGVVMYSLGKGAAD